MVEVMPPLTREDRERAIAERRREVGARPGDIVPNPGPQTAYLASGVDEAMYGGQAGGGKSFSLLIDALKHVRLPGYRALLLRRQGPQLTRTLIAKSQEIYPRLYPRGQVRWRAAARTWVFPSGATIELAAADKEADIRRYDGAEFAFIGLDELTHFTRYQYTFLFSRLRTTVPGLRTRIRGMTNPGGVGHDWVLERWAAWLYPADNPGYEGPRAGQGEPLWFKPVGEDTDEEMIVPAGTPGATSRTCFRASVDDTPQLGADYAEKNLANLDRLTRKRLAGGDWMAREVAGEFFERGWFEVVDACPADVLFRVRYWDLAGTAHSDKKKAPTSAWTAGLLLSCSRSGVLYIEHIARAQLSPGGVEQTIASTQAADEIEDPDTITLIERDPAQAGKFQAWYFGREMGIKAIPPQGDKLTRALRASAQAEVGNIKVVRGPWIEPFFREAETFPELTKDQIDALSGAVKYALVRLHKERKRRGEEGITRRGGRIRPE